MNKIAYIYVFDTMADWECGYIAAEINTGRFFKKGAPKYIVKTVAATNEPVVTMGGIRIMPDTLIGDCRPDNAGALILPGGETWLGPAHELALKTAKTFLDAKIPVGGICGATFGLARAGFFNNRHHTSNDLDYLKTVCPSYAGEKLYRSEPAIRDGALISASGTAPLEFARLVFESLEVFSDTTLNAWYMLHKTHEAKFFHELMASMQ